MKSKKLFMYGTKLICFSSVFGVLKRGSHMSMVPKSVVGMNVQIDDEEGDRVE